VVELWTDDEGLVTELCIELWLVTELEEFTLELIID